MPEKEHSLFTYDVLGVGINDAGQGFLHNTSVRCVGSIPVTKGEYDSEHGVCVLVDKDGDQVFVRYTASGRLGATGKVKANYIGGTGKYTGISGSSESTRTPLRPAGEGLVTGCQSTQARSPRHWRRSIVGDKW